MGDRGGTGAGGRVTSAIISHTPQTPRSINGISLVEQNGCGDQETGAGK